MHIQDIVLMTARGAVGLGQTLKFSAIYGADSEALNTRLYQNQLPDCAVSLDRTTCRILQLQITMNFWLDVLCA